MKEIYEIIKNWGLTERCTIDRIDRIAGKPMFIVNKTETEKYMLKNTEDEDRLHVEEDMLLYLRREGVLVFPPIRTKENKLVVKSGGLSYCLYKYIAGEHLEYDSPEKLDFAAKSFGSILGNLHKALEGYNNDSSAIKDMNLQLSVFGWALPKIEKEMQDKDLCDKIMKRKEKLRESFERNKKQFIHRDTHGDNLLFRNGKFIGILDFEICMVGYRIFDMGYMLTSMLVGDFYDELFRVNWLHALPILVESYNTVNPLTSDEREDIYTILLSNQLIVTAYYLGNENKKTAQKNLDMCKWFLENEEEIKSRIKGEKTCD